MEDKYNLLAAQLGQERVKRNESLIYHTVQKSQSQAEFFYIATSKSELIRALNCAGDLRLPFMVFGAGTNFSPAQRFVEGLVIKNRSTQVKVGAIKGKVGRGGIGVEEAVIEADSGVSLGKLDDFLIGQGLRELNAPDPAVTLGGAVIDDENLRLHVQKLLAWEDGEEYEVSPADFDSKIHVVLSLYLKVKSKN